MTDELRLLKSEKLRRLYKADPVCYAADVLGVTWWDKQVEIADRFASGNKVLVKASHGVGKTMVAGGLVNWHFDTHPQSITLTTAPTLRQVVNLLWKEVRRQRQGRPGLLPKAPRMEHSESWFAEGYTAVDSNAFQGHHAEDIAAVFDEAVGVDGGIWEATEGILSGGRARWLCIFNPTDLSSRAYEEDVSGGWDTITVSALDHPNIAASLRGEPEPFPGAVSLRYVEERLEKWCERVEHCGPTDVEFPPGSGIYYRPGPLFESRVLGRWPSLGFDVIWTEGLWESTLVVGLIPQSPTEIGCDVARFGDDWTVIVIRRGRAVVHHERHNGWSTAQTAGRLKELAKQFAQEGEEPAKISIKVDDDGVGGGVVDQLTGWNVSAISAASKAIDSESYPNRRSELWFAVAGRANSGDLDMSRLDKDTRKLMRRQLMGAKWKMNSAGQRVVESKDEMKKRLKKNNPDLMGGSPDDADALHLAFAPPIPKGWTSDPMSLRR